MNDINLPMMTLVDYRGFRLIAMSLLPLKGESLIYGSKDAGLTVYASNPEFNGLMKKAGQKLNLAPHLCGSELDDLKELWGACDIEGHRGLDGFFSLLNSFSPFLFSLPCDQENFTCLTSAGQCLPWLLEKTFPRATFIVSFEKSLCSRTKVCLCPSSLP